MIAKKQLIAFEKLPSELSKNEWIVTLSNPDYWKFDGVRHVFQYVYAPSYPEIEKEYEKEGIKVFREGVEVSESKPVTEKQSNFTLESAREELAPVVEKPKYENEEEDEGLPELPEQPSAKIDWRKLPWAQMRGLYFTIKPDEPKTLTKVEITKRLEQLEKDGLI